MIGKRQGFYMYICSREDSLAVTILEKIMRPSVFNAFFILFYFWQFFNENCHLFTSDPASLLGLRSIESRKSHQVVKWRKDEVYYIICNALHNLCNHPQCLFFQFKVRLRSSDLCFMSCEELFLHQGRPKRVRTKLHPLFRSVHGRPTRRKLWSVRLVYAETQREVNWNARMASSEIQTNSKQLKCSLEKIQALKSCTFRYLAEDLFDN